MGYYLIDGVCLSQLHLGYFFATGVDRIAPGLPPPQVLVSGVEIHYTICLGYFLVYCNWKT